MGELTLYNVNCLNVEDWNWNKKKNIEITNGVISNIYDSDIYNKSIANVLDFSDCWVIPGLVDMHVHYTWSYKWDDPDYPTEKADVLSLAYENLSELIHCGVTTCRDMGSYKYNAEWVKGKLQNDMSVPDMITCGNVITYNNGHMREFAYEIDNICEIKNAITKNVTAGADFVKITSDPSDSEAISRSPNPAFDETVLKRIVDAARKNGMHVACHTFPSAIGVSRALKSGVRTIEHAVPFDLTMESDFYPDVYYVPTFATAVDICGFKNIEECNVIKNKRSYLRAKTLTSVNYNYIVPESINEWINLLLKLVPIAISRNQSLCIGSDAGCKGTNFSTIIREILFLSAMGASNQQVLTYAITNPYKALGVNNKGKVKKGYVADLVILRENPLNDILALTNNVAVIHHGHCILNN